MTRLQRENGCPHTGDKTIRCIGDWWFGSEKSGDLVLLGGTYSAFLGREIHYNFFFYIFFYYNFFSFSSVNPYVILCRSCTQSSSNDCCNRGTIGFVKHSTIVQSSTDLNSGHPVFNWFIWIKNLVLDPIMFVCGTPPFGCPSLDSTFPISTVWVLFSKKDAIH